MADKHVKRRLPLVRGFYAKKSSRTDKILALALVPPSKQSEDELSDDDKDGGECLEGRHDSVTDTSSCPSLDTSIDQEVWNDIINSLDTDIAFNNPSADEANISVCALPQPPACFLSQNSRESGCHQALTDSAEPVSHASLLCSAKPSPSTFELPVSLALFTQQTPSNSLSEQDASPVMTRRPSPDKSASETRPLPALFTQQTPSNSLSEQDASPVMTRRPSPDKSASETRPLPALFTQQTPSNSLSKQDASPLLTSRPSLDTLASKIQPPTAPSMLSLQQTPSNPSPKQGPSPVLTCRRRRFRPSPSLQTTKRKLKYSRISRKKAKPTFNFNDSKFYFPVDILEQDFQHCFEELKSPLECFYSFFSEELINSIVDNTNLFSVQKTGRSVNVNEEDIKDFLAVKLIMGVVKLPAYTDYWSESLRYPLVADVMPLKKYQLLRSNIHFNDNTQDDGDPYFKIRPVLEAVRKKCNLVENETRQSIDEMMVPYKGTRAGSKRQYIKSKPKKWGYKLFTRCGVSGMVYDFLAYGGSDTFRGINFTAEEEELGLGGKVVVALCKTMQSPTLKAVYFDNFFSSLELMAYLRNNLGILALGTIRPNRLRGNVIPKKPKAERGTSTQIADNVNKLVAVKWIDNKEVYLVSNFIDSFPIETANRWDKAKRIKVPIACPQIVKQYNLHMGGVDLQDMLVSLYRTNFRSKKWYLRLFAQMVDISVNNAWLLYKRDYKAATGEQKKESLKDFRVQVALSLLKKGRRGRVDSNFVQAPTKIRNPTVSRPPSDVITDNFGHFPIYSEKGRCRYCPKGQTMVHCTKCRVRLCLTPKKNCFMKFHTL